jgi:hypothetical protein
LAAIQRNSRWILRLVGFILTLVSGCGLFNPTMPVPIDLSKAGNIAEAEFWIPQDDALEITLEFYYKGGTEGREYSHNTDHPFALATAFCQ